MKSLFVRGGGATRTAAVVVIGLFCLSGANCGGSPASTTKPAVTLTGNSPNGVPPPNPEETLINLINSQVRGGLKPLASDPVGTSVARAHSTYMDNTNSLSAIMNGQDFGTRLINAGVQPPVDVQPVLAQSFSDPNALVSAILANPTALIALRANVTRIAVALEGRASGNWWTILAY